MVARLNAVHRLLLASVLMIAPPSCASSGDDEDDGGDSGVSENGLECSQDSDCGSEGCSNEHQICDGSSCIEGCRRDRDCHEDEHCAKKCVSSCSSECRGKCKDGRRAGKEPPCKCGD